MTVIGGWRGGCSFWLGRIVGLLVIWLYHLWVLVVFLVVGLLLLLLVLLLVGLLVAVPLLLPGHLREILPGRLQA